MGTTGRMRKKRGDRGFTLIELLIVIVILGILAAIVVFAVGTTSATSVQAACHADAKSVETALESYKAQKGQFPTDPGSGDGSGAGWTVLVGGEPGPPPIGPWLKARPATTHYQISFAQNTGVITVATSSGLNGQTFDAPGVDACGANAK
ncbi:MAG TPA: prepilin-type N-terminal cleavage/methylation domain-containing protein [Acidimicrobiales bacterium]|nr:prepilin-type N-terminal cleavage/methylation domain-containing protein [Acidimicrobiales bacterium]